METINLSKNEAVWILLCKGWILKKYPIVDKNGTIIDKSMSFLDYIKPYFAEVYGWTADDFKHDFQRCVFNVLFDIFMKIRDNHQNDPDIKDIIYSGCYADLGNNSKDPIQRVIQKTRGEIAITSVLNNDKTKRFDLDQAMDLFIL